VRHLVSAVYDRAVALTDPPPVKVNPEICILDRILMVIHNIPTVHILLQILIAYRIHYILYYVYLDPDPEFPKPFESESGN
jgi:hypothetical protein